jgi:hypothetical protein
MAGKKDLHDDPPNPTRRAHDAAGVPAAKRQNRASAWRNRGLTDRVHPRRDHLVVALRAYRKAVADLNPATVFHRLAR